MTKLIEAVKSGDLRRLKVVLAEVANQEVNTTDINGMTLLDWMIINKLPIAAVKLLIGAGANINTVGEGGLTTLHLASSAINPELVKLLIEAGADVNATTSDKQTALYWACRFYSNSATVEEQKSFTEVIKLLIEAGTNINAPDKNGVTPLYILSAKTGVGHHICYKLLLGAGADVNAADENGLTPLHIALTFGYPEVVKLLLGAGADVNATNKDGFKPLELACRNYPNDEEQLKHRIEGIKSLIQFLLLQDLTTTKFDFIQNDEELSAYWDEQLKINYLLQSRLIGCEHSTKKILYKVALEQNNSLLFLSAYRLFKSLNSEIIKNKKDSDETGNKISRSKTI